MINNFTGVGRLTADPELRYTPSGAATCKFTLAINRPFSNSQGEKETDFIRVQVWRKQAENAANYLKKGSLAGIIGRIQTGSYEGQDGKKVFTTEVVADSVQFLEPKNAVSSEAKPNVQRENTASANSGRQEADPFSNSSGPVEVSDEDLPF